MNYLEILLVFHYADFSDAVVSHSKYALSMKKQDTDKTERHDDFLKSLPVVNPIKAFSPPSKPVIHHALMGPIFLARTPPKISDENGEASYFKIT